MFIIIVGIILFLVINELFIQPKIKEYMSLKKEHEYYITTFLKKQGGTKLYGQKGMDDWLNYDLRSWDGGKNWYAIDCSPESKGVKILGVADTVYPGLLGTLEGWDRLTKFVKKNGPIDPTDTSNVKILEDAGFTVTTTTKP